MSACTRARRGQSALSVHAQRMRQRRACLPAFEEGMKRIAATIPNGTARLELLPGLGHVPFVEAPERSLPPLVAFLKEDS